jgi:hypothetical protein
VKGRGGRREEGGREGGREGRARVIERTSKRGRERERMKTGRTKENTPLPDGTNLDLHPARRRNRRS